jgi:SAM-dependent methyltransferase
MSAMQTNSQFLYATALDEALRERQSWLDLGCGHAFLPAWTDRQPRLDGHRVVGIDADFTSIQTHGALSLRVCGDIQRLPVAAGTFDLVTANMVIEHLPDPAVLFAEVARVLKPGGMFLLHTPNRTGYTTMLTRFIPSASRPRLARLLHGRNERDVYPTYYRANSTDALRTLAGRCGLDVADVRTVTSSPQLFRVPGAAWAERRLLSLLCRPALARWRPCILARFVRRPGLAGARDGLPRHIRCFPGLGRAT